MEYLKFADLKNRLSIKILIPVLISLLIYSFTSPDKNTATISDGNDTLIYSGEKHFKNMRMLTNGGENAEAYFSFDDSKIIFQSTRGKYECDQIYTMNTDGSDVKMVSNGLGRTTCSYFYPDGKSFLYASTFKGSSECPPKPDMSQGYVWALYESFDIYKSDLNGNIIKQLTNEIGYDAEATISPKGDKIIFTSTRDGDIELYSMDLDGNNVKRLTDDIGYDGGAYYSYDGSMIVWRASRPKTEDEIKEFRELLTQGLVRPSNLEIYTANADGTNKKQVTNLNAASFGPYFFPDGKRIIFSSNVNDPKKRNFDLYAINTDGTGLEKITNYESFDGFPMFSMGGKKFVFCSNRYNQKPNETNVFICDWED